jgi:hypothetical protein
VPFKTIKIESLGLGKIIELRGSLISFVDVKVTQVIRRIENTKSSIYVSETNYVKNSSLKYIYIYMYIHIHTYTHTHTYILDILLTPRSSHQDRSSLSIQMLSIYGTRDGK